MPVEPTPRRRALMALAVCFALAAVVLIAAPLIGSTAASLPRALAGISPDREVLFELRLPRVILAMVAGACLSLAGALFQALLRDALATPYTLGVSSGAALGAVCSILLGFRLALPFPVQWLGAIVGAALVLGLVLRLASDGARMSSFTLLLAGVTINSICLALILFLHNFATLMQSFSITRWLMGGIDPVDTATLVWILAVVTPVAGFVLWRAREWNLLAVGEEWAESRGVDVQSLLRLGYLAGSLLTGVVTAFTGPIGFVGLIVPHALRMRLGADHRVLLPCSFLLGAAFLAICDTVARTVLAPAEVPVGVLTALLGGPFFIWLLRSRRRSLWL